MMRSAVRVTLTGLFCIAVAALVVVRLTSVAPASRARGRRPRSVAAGSGEAAGWGRSAPGPVSRASVARFTIIPGGLEDGGFSTASRFMAPIRHPGSLAELREVVGSRGRRGIEQSLATYRSLRLDTPPSPGQVSKKLGLEQTLGLLFMYEGEFAEASRWLGRALETSRTPGVAPLARERLTALMGIVALRRGEVANCLECLGPSSCIFPIATEAVHRKPEGAREAVAWFKDYLKQRPGDLRIAWLLNIATMALGEYPAGVPPEDLIPLWPFESKMDVGRFENVAMAAGLSARGPNLAGGSLFDDFDGDGRPDLFLTSLDADKGAGLFVNRGDGTFEDRSAEAGLDDQVYALNATRADFDNDGNLDVLMLRGGWEVPMRLSLLRNYGGGRFVDVTIACGLGTPIATESAAWGDYDHDGWIDLFVCGEFLPPPGLPMPAKPDPRNRCRLYHNEGNGTFRDVAAEAGVANERCAKGSAWGDFDDDGDLDLFVSNMGQPCRLYRNEGRGRFVDVAEATGLTGADVSFACWWWDFDNDGRLDLYLNDYRAQVPEVLACLMGVAVPRPSHPRLYQNLGGGRFREVSEAVGLNRALGPMGTNFGDIDNDGYPDIYLGTGDMSYSGLDRNIMLKNVDGRHFEDVTTSSGTGHLQKGHGVSFADLDGDGDLDLFVELGGAVPGDGGSNALFRNPGHGRHWLQVKLIGTTTNRAAIGARLRADLAGPDGTTRSIYQTIGNNSSFGGNSLVAALGLGDAPTVATLTVTWPTGGATQVFHGLPADRQVTITEGSDAVATIDARP